MTAMNPLAPIIARLMGRPVPGRPSRMGWRLPLELCFSSASGLAGSTRGGFSVMVLQLRSAAARSPLLTIHTKYEARDVKTPSKRSPSVKRPSRVLNRTPFVDGVLTFIPIGSSVVLAFPARSCAPFPTIGVPRNRVGRRPLLLAGVAGQIIGLAILGAASRLKGTTTLLKATSYMPHRPKFSLIRDPQKP